MTVALANFMGKFYMHLIFYDDQFAPARANWTLLLMSFAFSVAELCFAGIPGGVHECYIFMYAVVGFGFAIRFCLFSCSGHYWVRRLVMPRLHSLRAHTDTRDTTSKFA